MWSAAHAVETPEIVRMRFRLLLTWMPVQGMWGEGGPGTSGGSTSRSCPLHRPEAQIMAADALQLVRTPHQGSSIVALSGTSMGL